MLIRAQRWKFPGTSKPTTNGDNSKLDTSSGGADPVCNPSTQEAKEEGFPIKASLGYIHSTILNEKRSLDWLQIPVARLLNQFTVSRFDNLLKYGLDEVRRTYFFFLLLIMLFDIIEPQDLKIYLYRSLWKLDNSTLTAWSVIHFEQSVYLVWGRGLTLLIWCYPSVPALLKILSSSQLFWHSFLLFYYCWGLRQDLPMQPRQALNVQYSLTAGITGMCTHTCSHF